MNEKLLNRIKEVLVSSAVKNQVIEYSRLSREIGGIISPIKLNEPLGEISLRCIKKGFPPLSAIVVNQQTQLPGEGFFTWVASKMGYIDLPHSEWEDFFNKQKEAVFSCDWDEYLDNKPTNKGSNNVSIFSKEDLNERLSDTSYVIGDETRYYILTLKMFLETATVGPYQYQVVVLENHQEVSKHTLENKDSKQLLTPSKKKGFELLFEHNPMVNINDISMVHYKQDRLKDTPWDKEPRVDLEALYNKMDTKRLRNIVKHDVEMEKQQYASSYKDGEVKQYYGNRYERKSKNRLNAIEIHGTQCAVCDFKFEEVYGELGKDFIEIHHVKPLSTLDGAIEIDAENDLVPVCPNCHRMLHRKREKVLSVGELKEIIQSQISIKS
ncbi:HNH endonuclease [Bacillus sp. THAF10]|uniref:HNH endonuclease n=1 Tax=Bacillus sp. THAF10 TaxID=2587848 RepID=UPI0012684933|nr:HNH endonuclease [Bacillus sp. THAF10]QFT90839.1 HNH endonuclease [Bacillus sp. THAF10]